mmetsp:Transcript_15236/g.32780  ORF Transcript_15236/g.32780 Transcript_15236/m.32780 type:complete len:345 (+) Transcript_15236:78-1112(+)
MNDSTSTTSEMKDAIKAPTDNDNTDDNGKPKSKAKDGADDVQVTSNNEQNHGKEDSLLVSNKKEGTKEEEKDNTIVPTTKKKRRARRASGYTARPRRRINRKGTILRRELKRLREEEEEKRAQLLLEKRKKSRQISVHHFPTAAAVAVSPCPPNNATPPAEEHTLAAALPERRNTTTKVPNQHTEVGSCEGNQNVITTPQQNIIDDADISRSSNSNNNSNNNHSSSSRFKAVESYKNIRLAIGVLFEVALGSPPEHEWKSKKTVQHICNLFGPDYKSKRSFQITVKGVMRSVLKCQDDGIPFTAEGNYSGVGRKKKSITEIESVEAEVVGIADAIENGNSLKTT